MPKTRVQAMVDERYAKKIRELAKETYLDSESEVIRELIRQKFPEFYKEIKSGPAGVDID